MFTTLLTFWGWAKLLGGLSAIGAVVAAYFLGAGKVVEALTPLVKGAAEGVVAFVSAIWNGFLDMADNAQSLLFVATAVVCSAWYFNNAADLRKCNEDLKHTKTEVRQLKVVKQSPSKASPKVVQSPSSKFVEPKNIWGF